MNSLSSNYVIVLIVVATLLILMMALFSVSFIFLYYRRQRAVLREKQELHETYQRELLQSQIEIQNHTLQQIAQELHDHIGQLLTVAIMRLNVLEDDVIGSDYEQSVQQTRELVQTVMTDVRALSKTLDQDTVSRFGLLPSLTLELERIQRIGRVRTELVTVGEPCSLGEQIEIVLLRMAQESLNNALKHAHARLLTVTVDYQPDHISLTIADDGRGFDVASAISQPIEESGAGLSNLQRRATLLGGSCSIESRPGGGTQVHIQQPYRQEMPVQ